MAKPDRTCFGRGVCLHIGPCCDFWADDGMCVCNPVDAAEYPRAQRLYIAGNISGFANPNIRTVFPDGHDHVRTFDRGDYCWAYWDWGSGTVGTVKFELRDGSAVRASRSTWIVALPIPEGQLVLTSISAPNKVLVGTTHYIKARWANRTNTAQSFTVTLLVDGVAYREVEWIQADSVGTRGFPVTFNKVGMSLITGTYNPQKISIGVSVEEFVCNEGEKRNPKTCWDGTTIHAEVCRNNAWVPSGEICPPEPAAGDKRGPKTCWDRSVIHAEKYDAALHRWVPSGETCPVKVCNEGEKRNPKTCWDGKTIIHEQVCRNNAWVPSGETCPEKPECTEGDKKAGYVCVAGKWQPAPAVPEPVVPPVSPVVPPVAPPEYLTPEEAADRIRAGLPCYIKCTLPILDMLPGIPYTPGMWVPPFCEITTEP